MLCFSGRMIQTYFIQAISKGIGSEKHLVMNIKEQVEFICCEVDNKTVQEPEEKEGKND